LNASWRWEDQEQALLSSCSSLIAIVDSDCSRAVQFSHFSVKEFLMSPCLSTSSEDISRYHISLELAHTILAQACLGVLLQSDGRGIHGSIGNSSPLAWYAARHWVDHPTARTRRGAFERRWNIYLTNHNLGHGSSCTT
jgi:hypothetical protein